MKRLFVCKFSSIAENTFGILNLFELNFVRFHWSCVILLHNTHYGVSFSQMRRTLLWDDVVKLVSETESSKCCRVTCSGSVLPAVTECCFALMMHTVYTFLGALLAVVVYCSTKPIIDSLLKPSIAQSSNPYVLLSLLFCNENMPSVMYVGRNVLHFCLLA